MLGDHHLRDQACVQKFRDQRPARDFASNTALTEIASTQPFGAISKSGPN